MKTKDGLTLTTETVSPNREKTPEGYLLCKAVTISRVGTFPYDASDVPGVVPFGGRVLMSRSADELFSDSTMRSFEGKPVVVGHDRFADPSNWAQIAVGIVCNVRRGEGNRSEELVADLLLTKQQGIDLVESGELREVSCGYDAESVDDGDGKGHQVGIVGNHVALVNRARCGSTCQIKDGTMDKESLAQKLRALFDEGDKEGFEATLSELLSVKDEEKPEEAPAEETPPPSDVGESAPEEGTVEEPGEEEQTGDEEPPVNPEQSVEERLAVLEHEYQELGEKLSKLLDVEKAEGHEELMDGEGEEEHKDLDAEIADPAEVKEVIADAEEICPGMKKPVGDSAKGGFTVGALKRVKREAVKHSGRPFGDSAKLDGDALDIAFKACVSLARAAKNPSARVGDGKKTAPQGINERNAAYWKAR